MSETREFLNNFINDGSYAECARAAHERWVETKVNQGWAYGEKRDNENKINPFLVNFDQLPPEVQGANNSSPYAVANFLRNFGNGKSLGELNEILIELLSGKQAELLNEIGEYVHSHFIITLLAKGESTATRKDMVVYDDLDDETKSWDTQIALEVIEFLQSRIAAYLANQ